MTTPQDSQRKIVTQRCTNCGFDNAPGRSMCQNCGLPLPRNRTAVTSATTSTPVKPVGAAKASTLNLDKRTCPQCGHANLPAARQCSKCGAELDISDLFAKPKPSAPPIPTLKTDEVRASRTADAERLPAGAQLRLEIVGAASAVTIDPAVESTIGRRDPISNSAPEVDLTSFAAYRMGISRRHAAVRVTDGVAELLDLGSSNGTFVNGQRLTPHQPRALRNGDEIVLGRMQLRIVFQIR